VFTIRYPDDLPITARREDIVAAIQRHQVIILAGETGSGQITVNKRPVEDYFPTASQQGIFLAPLQMTGTAQSFDIRVKTTGGGVTGQAGAVRLGIARALLLVDAAHRPVLKKAGFLTRDARAKERLKPGRPGARKRFQFSKR
jgi:small subunit ribosomal protein S9